MSTDYRVEMQQEDQVNKLLELGYTEERAIKIVEGWYEHNNYGQEEEPMKETPTDVAQRLFSIWFSHRDVISFEDLNHLETLLHGEMSRRKDFIDKAYTPSNKTHDLSVWDVCRIWEDRTDRKIPPDVWDALKDLSWQGRNGDERTFKSRSIIQVLRYFIENYKEK